ncbi:MAG: MFS transporter [Propionibacteriaceae bacterium]|nr:MFS transporter [Propionibacteriaceae bacterium]
MREENEPAEAVPADNVEAAADLAKGKEPRLKFDGKERSWILYDWANSAYATIMLAAVFSAFFTGIVNDPRGGDYWWSIGTAIAMVIVALSAPIIGAFADFAGYKKKLFLVFLVLGLIATASCAIFADWRLLLVGYILSHIGFSGSNLLYDSFLPDVTTPERMDKLSGWGYAMGYIGGSTIPFVVSIALINFADDLGIGTAGAVRISVAMTAIWWGLFSIPIIKNVKQENFIVKPERGVARQAFSNILATAKKILGFKALFLFLVAYFFYIDGVNTIISLATSYGAQLGLGMLGMILALLVTQLIAFPFSILFSQFAKRFGTLNVITAAVVLYFGICIVGFFMGYLIEEAEIPAKLDALAAAGVTLETSNITTINEALISAGVADAAWNVQPAYVEAIGTSTVLFWVLAILVGTVQGGIQALSRSFFGKLVPPKNSGEFFGFFEIFGKFAAIMGPLLYALTKGITGRSSLSILSIVLLFLIAFLILVVGRKHMAQAQDVPE